MKPLLNVVDTELTWREREILKQADAILLKVQKETLKNCAFQSLETGEIVEADEIGRTRGVLNAFHECNYFLLRRR